MIFLVIQLFFFLACTRASFPSSGHLDFMGSAKQDNILHLKDPHVEVQDFSEAFRDIAKSEEKIKSTFRILNRPNDSRWKLDLVLIISKLYILDDESRSFEEKEEAWAVLRPLLEKYDKNFTYPSNYNIESGDYIEVTVKDWIDRYTQEKAVHKSPLLSDEPQLEGFGHVEVKANSEEKIKSTYRLLNRPNDSRWKFDLVLIISQLYILDDESRSFKEKEEAWAVLRPLLEKYDKNFTNPSDFNIESGDYIEVTVKDWIDRYTQEKAAHKSPLLSDEPQLEGSGHVEVIASDNREIKSLIDGSGSLVEHLMSLEEQESEDSTGSIGESPMTEDFEAFVSSEGTVEDDSSSEEVVSVSSDGVQMHYSTEQDSSEGYDLHASEEDSTEDETLVTQGYELHFTTDEPLSTEGYEVSRSDDIEGSSVEYTVVGTTEDGETFEVTDGLVESTTEYYLPEVGGQQILDVLAEEEGEESNQVSEELVQDGDFMQIQHRVGYVIHEQEKEPIQAGSIRGIPGVHFPDYDEIPITSFSCADKKYIPGFYADLETGCQVFHVCWPHRRESFLCPIGTLFNQAIMSCDYWYSTNCSLSPLYDDVNDRIHQSTTTTPLPPRVKPTPKVVVKPIITPHPEPPATPTPSLADVDWARVLSILPVKSKVFVYPQQTRQTKPEFDKTEKGKALNKAIATQIVGKVLRAAEVLAKTAVHTLPIKYAEDKSRGGDNVRVSVKPPKIVKKFVAKPPTKKFETLKPILASKLMTAGPSTKVDKQQMMQKVKLAKEHIPKILLGAMEMAGTVLQKDILPLTRMALVESSVKHSKSKKH